MSASDLEKKCELAVIAFLKSSPALSGRSYRRNADEGSRQNGNIIVSAKRGNELSPPSGVYAVAVQIEFALRINKRGRSVDEFDLLRSSIAERCEVHWKILADQLTKAAKQDFHCYDARIQSTDPAPQDGQHHYTLILQLDAMPVTWAQADGLKPNPKTPISFLD